MGTLPTSRVEALLIDLCVVYGYCLPSEAQEELLANPPDNPETFVDAVVVAEGLDPTALDKRSRDQLADLVRDWLFDNGEGRGTKSGLPRLPAP